ncbi:MAG: hypothetical protein JWO94_1660, partial [Verrucomicrobiaceae bacterium]|nr:hypothetical protein [Verrucomicrobiaceae bacterium]
MVTELPAFGCLIDCRICMDSSAVDPPPSLLEEAPPPSAKPSPDRASTRRSRVTSESFADVWTGHEPQEAVELPENLKTLGEALDKALQSEGTVGEAYSAFADKAFADAAAIPAASHFIVRLFAGQPSVLVDLVRTRDLLGALEHGSSELPRMIALRWQKGSMTQRISRFGESLILHQDRLKNAVAAEVLAAFAGLLALKKPERAAALFELATQITSPPGSVEFIDDVRSWLSAGQLIESLPAEDRAFWQLRLRKSEPDADWSTPEAQGELQAIAGKLKPDMPCAALFKELVPNTWWRTHVEPEGREEVAAASAPEKAAQSSAGTEALALEVVVIEPPEPSSADAAAVPPLSATQDSQKAPLSHPGPLKTEVPAPVSGAKVRGRSSSVLVFITGQLLGMALVAGVWALQPDLLGLALAEVRQYWTARPAAVFRPTQSPGVDHAPLSTSPAAPDVQPASAQDLWRIQETTKLAQAYPSMKPWVTKAQEGDWEECGPLISGHQLTAYPTQEAYGAFLKWLLLNP